jgi:hypothetical protein
MSMHHRLAAWIPAVALSAALFAAGRVEAQQFRFTLLDGTQVQGTLERLTVSGRMEGQGLPAGLELDGLRSIQRSAVAPRATQPQVVVELVAGLLNAAGVTLADEKLTVAWPHGDPVVLPIDQVRAIRFEPGAPGDVFEAALAAPSAEHDRLFLKVEDRLQSITGLVEKISDTEVVFDYDGQKRTLPRRQLYGIVVAQFEAPGKEAPPSRVSLVDGSRISGRPVGLTDGVLELQLKGESSVKLPLSVVARIDVRSSRLAFLSDLEPVEVEEQPLVTFGRPWQRDRSVSGGPLLLLEAPRGDSREREQRRFDKGLGVHARSRLVFETGGFEQFAATIGIDVAAEGRGDCEFVVLADGRELFRQRVRGGEALREVQLDLTDAKQITLLVEPGADLDLADHADWCDARLLKATR